MFGVPILASDTDFAREICGSAAQYFDANDPSDFARAVHELSSNRVLRDTLVSEGAAQLKRVSTSWQEAVTSVLHEMDIEYLRS